MVTSAYCGQLPVNGGHIGFQCNMTENWILWSDSEWTITPEYQSSGLSYDNKLVQNAISCCWQPHFIPRSCDLIKFTSIWFLIIDYIYTSIYTDLNQANLLQRAINYHENSFFLPLTSMTQFYFTYKWGLWMSYHGWFLRYKQKQWSKRIMQYGHTMFHCMTNYRNVMHRS